MKLIDGTKVARGLLAELKQKIALIEGRKPGLGFILVGDNPASKSYVQMKRKRCFETGIESRIIKLPHLVPQQSLIAHIEELNRDERMDGILVQQPLPSHILQSQVNRAVALHKDVDGFHPMNIGKLLLGEEEGFVACTPLGVMQLLKSSAIKPRGKHVVIIGRSNIVGKPLAALLIQKEPWADATVTIANSQTRDLESLCQSADILIVGIGQPHFITSKMVKKGAVVIDIGINRLDERLVGDVDFEGVKKKAAAITPVPGGVGPMTIAMLLSNTYLSYQRSI